MLGQKKPKSDVDQKVRKRFERLPTPDILNWADQAGSAVAQSLVEYRRHGNPDELAEARSGLVALLSLVDVLQERA